jgi:hypothetical protein
VYFSGHAPDHCGIYAHPIWNSHGSSADPGKQQADTMHALVVKAGVFDRSDWSALSWLS